MKKIHVGFICGGKSSEHEISLLSTKNIVEALDSDLFEATLFGVDKQGVWKIYPVNAYLKNENDPEKIQLSDSDTLVGFVPGDAATKIINARTKEPIHCPDVMFPVIHGTYGEDGSLQGFLNILGIPFVGADVLSSAVCMDKDVSKRLLEKAGIMTAPYELLFPWCMKSFEEIRHNLGDTVFVKPANEGSSIGVSKVTSAEAFDQAVQAAFRYDSKVIVEAAIIGREIECSVLGLTGSPMASRCGEVVVADSFYSYDAKYIDDTARVIIPAQLDKKIEDSVRQIAIQAYKALGCTGFARVDFFVSGDNIYVNELNTIPGFTNISMFPKLWEVTGIGYSELITRLIHSALNK